MIRTVYLLLLVFSGVQICSGQKQMVYEAINALADEYVSLHADIVYNDYRLLKTSINIPKSYSKDTSIIYDLSEFLSKDEIIKMLNDTSDAGSIWKEKLLRKAEVINSI